MSQFMVKISSCLEYRAAVPLSAEQEQEQEKEKRLNQLHLTSETKRSWV